jgi:putative intracellular protease/amidase/glyoxylase-like metal-dependent hydrolase (beta-lactamase superfamily II)
MSKKILFVASNYGVWAEELQAPWDTLKKAGHELHLATFLGKTPLPGKISMDPDFVDPQQKIKMNPPELIARVNEILDTGEWSNPIKMADANMDNYDVLVIVGGAGSALDVAGNGLVHNLIYQAYKSGKIIGALCYAVGALAFTRDPENGNKSILYGKTVTAHPHAWDFVDPLTYEVVRATPDNPDIKLKTSGFVFPLEHMVVDAVGPNGTVYADPTTSRERPSVQWDFPFVTGLSVESSTAFGQKLVEVLAKGKGCDMNLLNINKINKNGLNIHVVACPEDGELVNSVIIESANTLVIVDVMLLKPHAQELRSYADSLGKPINRVIITHFHPDHWAGLEYFDDLAIYAFAEVQNDIKNRGDWALSFHRPIHGDLITDRIIAPTNTIEEGPLEIDGVGYNILKIVDTEMPLMLAVEIPAIKTLIAQDLLYNKVFLYLGEKTSTGELCCDSWANKLEEMKNNGYETVIPGHGVITDMSLFDINIQYLKTAKEFILSSKTGAELKDRLMRAYPDYKIPLLLDVENYLLFPQDYMANATN